MLSKKRLPVTVNLLFKSENESESRSQMAILDLSRVLFQIPDKHPHICIAESLSLSPLPVFLRVVFVTHELVDFFSPSKYGGRLVRDEKKPAFQEEWLPQGIERVHEPREKLRY